MFKKGTFWTKKGTTFLSFHTKSPLKGLLPEKGTELATLGFPPPGWRNKKFPKIGKKKRETKKLTEFFPLK